MPPHHSKTIGYAKSLTMLVICCACSIVSIGRAAPQTLNPGDEWPDDRGKHIQAHGGGIIQLGDTYFWFGEDRSKDNDPHLRYVACYSSQDLAHWKFRNQVVKIGRASMDGASILERPKVFYNRMTGIYVMYAHLDDSRYKLARVGVFACDKIDGDFKFVKSFRPLDRESRDIGQFIDDDGEAYLIFEDRPLGFHIAKLSDDYMTVEKDIHLFPRAQGGTLEGGALVHYDGLYYVVGSQLSGWSANSNRYATAPSLGGPWTAFRDIAPPALKTYGSQSTMLLKITGTKKTTVVFMADIWTPKAQWNSRYLWMPMEIADGKMVLPAPTPWTIDVLTGETSSLTPAKAP